MMQISEELASSLYEAKPLPIGTKRQWKSGWFIKTRKGWVRLPKSGGTKEAKKREDMPGSADALKKAIDEGKLKKGMSLADHVRKAKKVRDDHEQGIGKFMQDLQSIAPEADVQGRVKQLDSIIGKLVRKPKYGDAEGMQDTTGSRVLHDSIDGIQDTVRKIKERYNVIDEDDYISNPKEEGYMSHHLIVQDDDGLSKEIQVRTHRQNELGEWAHNIYKPLNEDQEKALEKAGDQIRDYAKQAWKHIEKADRGKDPGKEPDCPEIVRKSFGCAPMD